MVVFLLLLLLLDFLAAAWVRYNFQPSWADLQIYLDAIEVSKYENVSRDWGLLRDCKEYRAVFFDRSMICTSDTIRSGAPCGGRQFEILQDPAGMALLFSRPSEEGVMKAGRRTAVFASTGRLCWVEGENLDG